MESLYHITQEDRIVGMLDLDLRKTVDTVNHKILEKLQHYGISGISLKRFFSYLENRTQMACINGSLSDPLSTVVILRQFLSIIYMNDLVNCLKRCTTNMYTEIQQYLCMCGIKLRHQDFCRRICPGWVSGYVSLRCLFTTLLNESKSLADIRETGSAFHILPAENLNDFFLMILPGVKQLIEYYFWWKKLTIDHGNVAP